MTQVTQDGNGSARRKRFAKCGHLGFGQFCHRCQLADTLEKEGKEAKHKEKMDPKALAARVASLRSIPGVTAAPAKVATVSKEYVKPEDAPVSKPALTEREKALKAQFNPLPSLGKEAEDKVDQMARINARAAELAEG